MKLPYGISDFKALREQGNLYIDKTRYIERLEGFNSKYVFFIRPRRFGKSLFLSTLEHYYDINAKANFDSLFCDLYIGQNPTPLKNHYLVLQFDFSALDTENKEVLKRSFVTRIISKINRFLKKYKNYFEDVGALKNTLINTLDNSEDVGAIMNALIDTISDMGHKIYLIIDEYDHFANDIIAMGESDFYKDIIRATGFVRDFYEAVKMGTKGVIDRIFIVGASPIMLDDMTSGFNIASNVTTNATLNEMLGFTCDEVRRIVDNIDICKDKEGILEELRKYYNGYLFNINGSERVYNSDMVLYFFKEWEDTGYYPTKLIDHNVKTDYGKMERLIGNEENRKIIEVIIKEESIVADIQTEFSFDRMYDKDYFVSLLFYMGLLSINGEKYGQTELTIPNYVIRTVFWEYFEKSLRERFNIKYQTGELAKSIWEMGALGTIEPFISFVSEKVIKQLSNRDLIGFDEKYIKVLFFAYFVNSNIYKPVSEQEVENGYVDIYLKREKLKDVKYDWIIELKYVKSGKSKLEQVREESLAQLDKYASSRGVVGRDDVKKALVIFIGKTKYEIVES